MSSAFFRVLRRNRRLSTVFAALISAGLFGVSPLPAFAHCAGKHIGDHPHCDGGGDPPPAFNPEIVWMSIGKSAITIANGDGSNPTSTGFGGGNPSWSPAGTEILFGRGAFPAGVYRLPVFNATGEFSIGTPELVVPTDEKTGGGIPRWSPVAAPDGNFWIAYMDVVADNPDTRTTETEVFLYNPNTDTTVQLTDTERAEWDLTWSHDATRIAVRTIPTDGDNKPNDIVIYSLGADGSGNLTVEEDSVSLLMDNGKIITDPTSNAAILADPNLVFGHLDWANTGDRIVVKSKSDLQPHRVWIIPVGTDDPQQAVADGTVIVMEDVIPRLWPRWSPDDSALLYRRNEEGGTCSVPSVKKGRIKRPSNFVIGILTPSGESGTGPLEIKCEDENVLSSTGNVPEWWRGGVGFPPPSP